MRSLIREMLHAFGIREIRECIDGDAGFNTLLQFEADLLLVDWKMEECDGLELTRKIRTDPKSPNKFVPIVMLTGYSERERVIEARDAGVTEFMSKPVSAKALYKRFAAVIEHPRPYVEHDDYFGPDRRRSAKSFVEMDRRANDPNAAIMDPEKPIPAPENEADAAPEGESSADPDAANDPGAEPAAAGDEAAEEPRQVAK